jgi:hypothetical protein
MLRRDDGNLRPQVRATSVPADVCHPSTATDEMGAGLRRPQLDHVMPRSHPWLRVICTGRTLLLVIRPVRAEPLARFGYEQRG